MFTWSRAADRSHLLRLDMLRGIGALLVLYSHFFDSFAVSRTIGGWPFGFSIIAEGKVGVALFCVISGFIFEYLVRGERVDYKNFIIARLWRIYPLYVFTLVFAEFVFKGNASGLITQLLAFVPTAEAGDIWSPTWSIVVEFQFYLIFPFLTLLLRHEGYRQLLLIIAFFVATRLLLWSIGKDVNWIAFSSICGRMDQFLAGMIAGRLFYQSKARFLGDPAALLAVVAVTLVAIQHFHVIYGSDHPWMEVPMPQLYAVFWPTIQAICFAALLLGFLRLRASLPKWMGAPLIYIGKISFSIYLMHRLVEFALAKQLDYRIFEITGHVRTDTLILCSFVDLPIVLALASLAYYSIERPFLGFKKGYLKSNVAEPAPVTAP
jgi:peptidoglycan/LPS O-acetylase OafA/YrhL